ncbi:hypothetical protein Tdes44962_MAKER01487 [Teratosphaeria destructans]|uniref:Uncharacterized protein n=1 Tax=Teratosphaeria destructans TaxID=418781 RepID=A0A9W7SZE2_9PEZI|nr:hypothetical protein Tdes44962_MAKER01487 [Teratosphaeria destructans]
MAPFSGPTMHSAHNSVLELPSVLSLEEMVKAVMLQPFGSTPAEIREEDGWTTVRARRPRPRSDRARGATTTEKSPDLAKFTTTSRFHADGYRILDVVEQDGAENGSSQSGRDVLKKSRNRRKKKSERFFECTVCDHEHVDMNSASSTDTDTLTEEPMDEGKFRRLLAFSAVLVLFLVIGVGYAWVAEWAA